MAKATTKTSADPADDHVSFVGVLDKMKFKQSKKRQRGALIFAKKVKTPVGRDFVIIVRIVADSLDEEPASFEVYSNKKLLVDSFPMMYADATDIVKKLPSILMRYAKSVEDVRAAKKVMEKNIEELSQVGLSLDQFKEEV